MMIVLSNSAMSFSFKIGTSYFLKSNEIDHDKYGVALGLSFFENKKRRIIADFQLGTTTSEPANPGAGNNPTAPDEKEDFNGSFPLYSTILYEIKSKGALGYLGVGTTFYSPDFNALNYANFFSESLTIRNRKYKSFSKKIVYYWGFQGSLGLTSKQLPFIISPQIGISYLLGKYMELNVSLESLNMFFIGDGPESFQQNIAGLNLIFPNQF